MRRIATVLGVFVFAVIAGFGSWWYADYTSADTPCPCGIFGAGLPSEAPTAFDDSGSIELGVRFTTEIDGYITGIRFYKDASMTDAHTGTLWDSAGNALATKAFSSETASGWQTVTFDTPVAVTAGSIYTASFYTPNAIYVASSSYFTVDRGIFPIRAPRSATMSALGHNGNGVYRVSGGYPNSTFNSANYWVDATFKAHLTETAPTITAVSPASGATGVSILSTIYATSSVVLDPVSVDTDSVILKDADDTVFTATITATTSWNGTATTSRIIIDPGAMLAPSTQYTVTIKGGAGNVTNVDGTPLAADYVWSFTTGTDPCPCSVWNESMSGYTVTSIDNATTTVTASRFYADSNGYIRSVRFFKPLLDHPTATSVVSVYTTGGTLLARATSTQESKYGWQEIPLGTPLAVTAGTRYVVARYSSSGGNVYTSSLLTSTAGTGPIHNDAGGAMSKTGAGNVFPDANHPSFANLGYWIDVVFTRTSSVYAEPFQMIVAQPQDEAYGFPTDANITLTFSNPIDESTIASAITLTNSSNATVPASITVYAPLNMVVINPTDDLTAGSTYHAQASTELEDIYGTPLSQSYTIDFRTGVAHTATLTDGLSGPILIISANATSTYAAEMLRAEGITYFDVESLSVLDGSLSSYKRIILTQTALTQEEADVLTDWVEDGGTLIAFRPDKKLASLFGLTDATSTLSEGYILVDDDTLPGAGITNVTMQFHGTADLYTAHASTSIVALLYSDANTATVYPAVASAAAGDGRAIAFTYDLADSIIRMHQGNMDWIEDDHDGDGTHRPNDLFDGGADPDWLNLNKAWIPQADEQQRLMINALLSTADDGTEPLPRFWILPHGIKAALVMEMDDHTAVSETASSTLTGYDRLSIRSDFDCSWWDWECHRGGSLVYPVTNPMTTAQALLAQYLGFATGAHINLADCVVGAQTFTQVNTTFTTFTDGFATKFPGVPMSVTSRTHCYAWPEWDYVPRAAAAHDLRIDYGYVWYPASWTGAQTGYINGSGMSMRFADLDGDLIDLYQGVTGITTDNASVSTTTMRTMFQNMQNANEFYGTVGTHYDDSAGSNTYIDNLMSVASETGMKMISGDQLAIWKDALENSKFANIETATHRLAFTVQVAEGGVGMQAMVPTETSNDDLTSLKRGGTTVTYETVTRKGIEYAMFDAVPGDYVALYGDAPPEPASDDSGQPTQTSTNGPIVVAQRPSTALPNFSGATIAQIAQLLQDIFKRIRDLGGTVDPTTETLVSSLVPSAHTPDLPVRDLKAVVEGEDVRRLQQILIAHGYSIPAGATGRFGAQTRAALAAYQHDHGIAPAAGYFGAKTRAQMKKSGVSDIWW